MLTVVILFLELKRMEQNLKSVQEGEFGSTWAMGTFQIVDEHIILVFVVLDTSQVVSEHS